ncbi:hypothetical protein NSQ51_11830 [Geobacillus sp. FSL K6-0789]|uniref:RNA polymerase subunit sigma-70 n=2 Tax=Geobacillus TaxID=129337 RepID=A0A0K9HZ85_GEOSE|nr:MULTISPECIES: hypothetical protein [Geobacillus]AGE23162.1 hypothetical protein GHH_c26510 [Geobacillus sp. GHH01]ATA60789.1 hypothetical protein GS458_2350 [Geobacillus stearothermophilus]ESU71209.1 hypothetical protein T260_14650 [Geobacillus sp. MAS1]KAF6510157.1 hypothetical protein GS8_2314 [Geobacillus stearothermophilus]KMY59129.1 RNA polymerase subunit sigma-70 [Geobacillus stearothermophilus]
MRQTKRGEQAHRADDVLSADFHEWVRLEAQYRAFELASEFGVAPKDVQMLKKQQPRP